MSPPRLTGPHFAIVYTPWGVRFVGVEAQVARDFLSDMIDWNKIPNGEQAKAGLPAIRDGATVTVDVTWYYTNSKDTDRG